MELTRLEDMGREYAKDHPDLFENLLLQRKGDEIAVFCYTSGTTGLPKGAMLSHRNLLYAVNALRQYNQFLAMENYLSYISPAWLTEQILGLCGGVSIPLVLHFPEKPATVPVD